ncbi:phosphate ABC transporter substrate-binding protein PstS [Rugosimonospora acidiphila]|uniref:Phosphate-binding protein n=1 Tax=Rugosimonospora acidiphila TaxID=556531 RepID=A0ABP9RI01_9ACTN
MKLQRHGILAGLALTATFALAACGSDNNTASSPSTPTGGSSASASTISCATGTLNAQGSTAQQNAINQWVKDYQTQCSGANIVYQGTGSGAGQQAFISGTADFAGSDSALTAADQPKANNRCKTGPAIHLPMAVGPIAVVYNVQGVSNLQLKPATLAKIFSGKITTWNDAAIKADNPGATLPSTKILTLHRSDSSGTSDNFTNYLSTVDPTDWTFGHDKTWKGPGGDAEKGSDGIAAQLGKTDGAIGYVEWSYAQADSLNTAKIGNAAGQFQDLTAASAGVTIASAQTTGTGDDMQMKIDYNTTAQGAYPIVLVTYEIVCEQGNSSTALPLLKGFLGYTSSSAAQQSVTQLGYAPLPETVRTKVAATVAKLS